MTRQNRVLPTGEIAAHPARGTLTGNRGILRFDNHGQLGTSRWQHHAWICCTLTHPRGKYQGPAPDRSWTPLFFLDEAVALAAGHRPCAYCRPRAYARFKAAWEAATGTPTSAKAMDAALHAARVTRGRGQVRHEASARGLPTGAFILWNQSPHLVLDGQIIRFLPEGYAEFLTLPDATVTILTPRPTLAVLRAGFSPKLHQSATAAKV